MPASNPVMSQATLAAAVRNTFSKTYDPMIQVSTERLRPVMDLGLPAKARTETFAAYESAPYLEYWPYGETIPQGNFKSFSWQVTCRRFGKRVSWNEDDRKDDQTQSLMKRVRTLGTNAGIRHERAFFDLLQATANYLPTGSVNAPDGAALYATTAGGAARFGVTNGNLLAGNGVGSVAVIHQDYYRGIAQALQFLDTEGQPLIDEAVIDQGVTLVHGAANLEIFERSFSQNVVQGSSAGISNIVKDAMRRTKLWPTSRIADNDWYLFFNGVDLKPIAHLELESLQTDDATRANSDFVRDRGEEYFQAYARDGYTINIPYGTVKINN
jgi:phage major head subunit gpT-like protein